MKRFTDLTPEWRRCSRDRRRYHPNHRRIARRRSMKKCGLLGITAATILLTGFALRGAGWFRCNAHSGPGTFRSASRESVSSAVVLRHAQGQASHWRDCLIAR
jgi:hypothetical protein